MAMPWFLVSFVLFCGDLALLDFAEFFFLFARATGHLKPLLPVGEWTWTDVENWREHQLTVCLGSLWCITLFFGVGRSGVNHA